MIKEIRLDFILQCYPCFHDKLHHDKTIQLWTDVNKILYPLRKLIIYSLFHQTFGVLANLSFYWSRCDTTSNVGNECKWMEVDGCNIGQTDQ